MLVGVLAVVGLLTSVFALWARAVIFDSSEVGDAVEVALAEPEVSAALAAELTDQAIEAVDLERRIDDVLPEDLAPLVPALVGGVRAAVADRLEDVLAADSTRTLLATVVEGSHARLMGVLDGDGVADGVTVENGEVQLNLLPLVGLGLREVQDLGYLEGVEVPELTADGEPAEQIATLERLVGRDLPIDFSQLTVYRDDAVATAGETVETARRMLQLAKRALAVVLVVTLASYTATVMLALRRARTVLVLALSSVAVLLVARAFTRAVVDEAPVVAVNPAARAAISATLSSLASGLFTILTLAIAAGVAVATVAFLRSDATVAVRIRRAPEPPRVEPGTRSGRTATSPRSWPRRSPSRCWCSEASVGRRWLQRCCSPSSRCGRHGGPTHHRRRWSRDCVGRCRDRAGAPVRADPDLRRRAVRGAGGLP